MANKYCPKCGRTLKDTEFQQDGTGEKMDMCKKCITMHIDNFDPETFLWLLEKADVPYIPSEWNSLRDKAYEKNPDKINGMSVFGKYLSKMKLKQWREYSYKDSASLQEKEKEEEQKHAAEAKEQAERAKQNFDSGLISEAEYKTLVSVAEQKERRDACPPKPKAAPAPEFYDESAFVSEDELPDMASQLTQEDKIYLVTKWGRYYKPNQLVQLEQKYTEMMSSFDIQDADSVNSLILICKTNLKMNECLDSGAIEEYQKLSRVYDSLRKSTKLTAAQNKDAKGDFVDCLGSLVALCEKEEGFIPRFATDVPQDKIDISIQDTNNYLKKLITEDLGFGAQIEDAIKKLQIQHDIDEQEKLKENDPSAEELNDDDFIDFQEHENDQRAEDDTLIKEESD